MSQTVNLVVSNNVGCGMPEGKCFPSSRVYGRTTAVYSCPFMGRHRIRSHVKIGGLKSGSLAASIVCEARKNPDFSRQNNRNVPSRGKNSNVDGRDIFENFEEDMLSSKNGNGPVSLSSGKFQSTSSPGTREKEIVELFKKVQAQLRERASVKEEKKTEAPRGQVEETSAVDSLLNLLKKHSSEEGKRGSGEDSGIDHNSDQLQESNQYNGVQSTNFFDSNSSPKNESRDANTASAARPRSIFRKKSPVPRVKYENVEPIVSEDNVNNRHQIDLKPEDLPEPEPEPKSEIDLDTKDELFFPELLEDDSHEAEQTYNEESVEEQLDVQSEDLSALKLSDLRALAKSRGVKGYSKMKKVDLIELLTES
ncbi:rho-N domain-containing protein 1, chloroplastic [Vicia villosa]|uniref:rho-N domain-containing protein 1, chloroplastic n=1 Tax=Vicia villosa TaxID=3911 RepID=UPI00273C2F12|nr:rho-N domain-containing protein 1, chloroplastic [Vicia villosa]